jgi:tetratricopeptide (TPR) repeat protein
VNRSFYTKVLCLSVIVLTSCSITQQKPDQAKNKLPQYLDDGNRAPASMSPPGAVAGDSIDPTYLRTQADYHFTLGETYSLEGNHQRAIEEFKLTLVYDPQSSDVRTRLAAEYIKIGFFTEAMEQAEKAVQEDPSSVDARMLLGGIFSAAKLYDKAAEQYRSIIKSHPDNMDAHLYLGAVLAEQSQYSDAIATFEAIANKNPKVAHRAQYYIARVELERGNTTQAIRAFRKSISSKPAYTDAVYDLAMLYEKQDEKQQAFVLLKSFQDKHGPNEKIAEPLSRYYLEKKDYKQAYRQLEIISAAEPDNLNVRVKMALISIELKDYSIAIAKLKEILAIAPQSDKIRFYLAAVYEEINDKSSAIENFLKIPPTSSYYQEAVIHASYLYKQMGDQDRAEAVVKEGIDSRSDIPQFYALYASLLDDQKKYQEAVDMLKDAIERFPKNEQLMFYIGSMYDKLEDKDKTIEYMKSVLEINNEHVQALNYLAYTYAELNKDLDNAELLARKAVNLKPDDPYIKDTLGWVLYKKGQYADAVKYLEAAYKLNKDEAIIAEHLGDAYYRFQLPSKAKTMYQRAVELETNEDTIRKIQQKLTAMERGERMPASLP